jgi:hypothetical protein
MTTTRAHYSQISALADIPSALAGMITMRLTDLEPRWLLKDGIRVGFIFRSPTRQTCWQSCFQNPPPRREQWALFSAALGTPDESDPRHDVQGCKPEAHWTITPDIAVADFASLSVQPSLDGSAGGNWHGHIINGEIVGGL